MKVFFKERELELWQGARGYDLLTPEEQEKIEAGDLVLWEKNDGWVGLGGALRDKGKYRLLDAKLARLRLLPSMDRLLANPAFETLPHQQLLFTARKVLDDLREEIHKGEKVVPQMESIIKEILINLVKDQTEHSDNTPGWMNPKVRMLNDPFASLSQALLSISNHGSVALPRQQLIEQDGMRVEDCIKEAGWAAVPLGTINHCKYSDFVRAITTGIDVLAFLMPDNYEIIGFVSNIRPAELATLALARGLDYLYYPGNTLNGVA